MNRLMVVVNRVLEMFGVIEVILVCLLLLIMLCMVIMMLNIVLIRFMYGVVDLMLVSSFRLCFIWFILWV